MISLNSQAPVSRWQYLLLVLPLLPLLALLILELRPLPGPPSCIALPLVTADLMRNLTTWATLELPLPAQPTTDETAPTTDTNL
ncbi:MAG: hypothetical protein AAFW75_21205 [Cyanobacteria bacterium J06636_16]